MSVFSRLGAGPRLAVLYGLMGLPVIYVVLTGAPLKGASLIATGLACAAAAALAWFSARASALTEAAIAAHAEALVAGTESAAPLPAPIAAAYARLRKRLSEQSRDGTAEAEAIRIRIALDKVATNVMVCDVDGNINYMNEAVADMFRKNAGEIRKQLPNFDATRILGANFDIFHRNPAHQRNMLASLRATHTASMTLGNASLRIIATPVVDPAGVRLGYVVQWLDRTQEVATEQEVSRVVKAAGDGDLTSRIPLENKADFFAALATGINSLLDGMAATISSIKGTAAEVSRGAEEISRGNINLSQRTEEQAASLEETASSMEQMTSTVRQNADNAVQANALAAAARTEAERGGAVVAEAVVAMQGINTSSAKITDIIGVIDTIAFQTNLLALNAAVEAARAGEQGRGFAVVASEVRNLASRSSEAAKEIKRLIQDSSQRVAAGTQLVDRSGQALGKIVASVQQVSQIVSEIAAASQEQSAGIEQVNKAVTSMDEVTQQNAALVEQAAAAAQALMEEARGLDGLMEKYRIGEGHAAAPAARAAPPARLAPRAPERRAPTRPFAAKAAAKPRAATPARATGAAAPAADWDEF